MAHNSSTPRGFSFYLDDDDSVRSISLFTSYLGNTGTPRRYPRSPPIEALPRFPTRRSSERTLSNLPLDAENRPLSPGWKRFTREKVHPAPGYQPRKFSSDEKHTPPQDLEAAKPNDAGGPPKQIGFWDKELEARRKTVVKEYARLLLLLCTFILAVLSLYWASLWNAVDKMDQLNVYIVNFDSDPNALVGPSLVEMVDQILAENPPGRLGYQIAPPSQFNNDPLQVRQAVWEEEAWAALIVNPNATHLLRQAIDVGNTSYDPHGAGQLIYQDSRDQNSFAFFILPQLTQLETDFTALVGQRWATELFSNASISTQHLEKVPQAISPAVAFSTYNLRPFSPGQSVPSVTVGLIFLIILSFFSVSFFMPIHLKLVIPNGTPILDFNQFIIWRWTAAVTAYFFISLTYSFVSMAFQIPFSNSPASPLEVVTNPNPFGSATFVVYWLLNFIGMIALGMACENVALVIGFPWAALWLIFWVITNVTTAFNPLELVPRFYMWGYAWPLHNIVEGSRTLIYGLPSSLGLNFGILFAWVGVNTLLFPVCNYFMRWKQMRAKMKEQQQRS